jgi:hypothetical protein
MEPGVIAVFVPIVGMRIPIIYILVKHQQKMAEIVHSNRMPTPEVESLRREVAEMKALLHQQVIALDSRGNSPSLTPPTAPDQPNL